MRLLTTLSSFQALFNRPQIFWTNLNWFITCVIIIPLSLFLYQLADEYLRKLIRWVLAMQSAFAIFGILGAAFGLSLTKLYLANNTMILLTLVAVAILLVAIKWRVGAGQVLSQEFRVFIAGFLFWMVFVLQTSQVSEGCQATTWSLWDFWALLRALGTCRRIGLLPTKNACWPSTKSWKSRGAFSLLRCRKVCRRWRG